MYILKTESTFDSAHFLSGYEGKCANIHGHRWSVEIEVGCEELQPLGSHRGMIVDFSKLKKDLSGITDELDHSLIIEEGSLKQNTLQALREENFRVIEVHFRPTAECFAKFFFDEMSERGYNVLDVTVYETPKNSASYRK